MFCCLVAKACSTLCNAMDCSMPGFPVLRISWSLLKFMSIESVRLSDHLILCHPLFLLTSMFPSFSLSSKSETLVLINPGFHTVTPIQLVKNPEILIHCRRQCFQPGFCEINNTPTMMMLDSLLCSRYIRMCKLQSAVPGWYHPDTRCVTGSWTWQTPPTERKKPKTTWGYCNAHPGLANWSPKFVLFKNFQEKYEESARVTGKW